MDFRSPGSNPFGVLNPQQSAPSAFSQTAVQQQQQQAPQNQGGPPQLQVGPELDEVQTENFAFLGIAGDTKVRLFQDGFNEQNMPIPTASLLAIASKRGLVAAAGPSSFILSETSKLRSTYVKMPKRPDGSSPIADFQPQLSLPVPTKISHVAFTADEKYLLLGASAGGIAVYSVDSLLAGNQSTLFELPCDPIIDMKPIPTVEKADLVCVLTGPGWGQPGQVNMVDLTTKQIQKNLKSGVTAISWSPKGKQIVCGGITGGLCWIQPDGQNKGEIPGVPGVENHFVSSLLWIETHIFYVVHTPAISAPPTVEDSPDNNAVHHILQRSGQQHNFNKVFDTVSPFGMSWRPTSHTFLHLRNWPPKLQDLIIMTNTCSTDVGIVSRFSGTNFQPCSISNDTRRAQLPLDANNNDTSPTGLAVDLSVTKSEIPENAIYGSSVEACMATPAVMILNNAGILLAYWFIYEDAVRMESEAGAYPGLIAYGGGQQQQQQQSVPQTPARQTFAAGASQTPGGISAFGSSTTPTSAPAFGQPAQMGGGMFGKALSYGSPQTPQTATAPAFGAPTALGATRPAFGSPAALGGNRPAFGSTTAMGGAAQPAFGSTSALGGSGSAAPAFGSASALGSGGGFGAFGKAAGTGGATAFGQPSALGGGGASAFGQPSQLGSGGSAFGQPSALGSGSAFGQPSALGANKPAGGAFGALAAPAPAAGGAAGGAGGFGRFASGGGFLAAAGGQPPATPSFLQGGGTSAFASSKQDDSFSGLGAKQQQQQQQPSAFGAPAASGFALKSTFGQTATPTTQAPAAQTTGSGGIFGGFGSSLGGALEKPGAATIPEEDMDDEEEEPRKPRDGPSGATMFDVGAAMRGKEPATTAPANGAATSTVPATGLFANALAQKQQASVASPTGSAFGTGLFGSAMKQNQTSQPEQKSAFGAPAATTPTGSAFGTGLFGSALKANDSKPAGGFGAFGSPQQTTSSFGSPAAVKSPEATSAFGAPTKPPSSFGGVFAAAAAQNEKAKSADSLSAPKEQLQSKSITPTPEPEPLPEVKEASSKGLPDDSDDEADSGAGADAGDAPLPPDFTTDRSAKAGWGSGKMALPTAAAKTPAVTSPPIKKEAEEAPLPPDFTTDKTAKGGWGAGKMSLPTPTPGTPPVKKEPTPTPPIKKEPEPTPPPSSLFSSVKKEDSSPSVSSVLKTTPKAGPGRIGAFNAKGRASAGKDKDEKKKFTMADVADGNVTPFSIFGSGGKPATPAAASPSAAGGLFGGKKEGFTGFTFQEYKPGDSDDEEDEEGEGDESGDVTRDSQDHEDGEGDEDEEGEEEEDEGSYDEEEEDAEWIDSAEGSDAGGQDFSVSLGGHKVSSGPSMGRYNVGESPPAQKQAPTQKPTNQPPPPLSPVKQKSPAKPKVSSPVKPRATMPAKSSSETAKEEAENRERAAREKAVAEQKRIVEARNRLMEQQRLQRERELEAERARREELFKEEAEIVAKEEEEYRALQGPFKPCEVLPELPSTEITHPTLLPGRDAFMETIYQSIDSTIKSFGVSARELQAYVTFNKRYVAGSLDEIYDDDDCGMSVVPTLIQHAEKVLDQVKELQGKDNFGKIKREVNKISAEGEKLEAKSQEIASLMLLATHPAIVRQLRARPLTIEQKKQQDRLRRKIPHVRRLLLDAEENFTILQARVAGHNKIYKTNKGNIKPPTHEAVRNTLNKLTAYARQKRDDIDTLEESLRRMRMRSTSPMMSRGTTPSASVGPSRSNTFTSPRRGSTPLRKVREGTPMSAAGGTSSPVARRSMQKQGSYLTSASPETFAYFENTPEGKKSRLRQLKFDDDDDDEDEDKDDASSVDTDAELYEDPLGDVTSTSLVVGVGVGGAGKASFPAFSSFDRSRDRERIEGRRSWVEQGERKPKRLSHTQEVVLAGLEAEGQSPLRRTGTATDRDFAWYEGDRKFRREAKGRMARVFKRVGVVETIIQS